MPYDVIVSVHAVRRHCLYLQYYLDGGVSDNIPVLDGNTITVSPFSGESDICPRDPMGNAMHMHLANTSIQLSGHNIYRYELNIYRY